MNELITIEETFGTTLPATYKTLHNKGCFDLNHSRHLWIYEAEWVPPIEIPTRELLSYGEHVEGLIPFAFSGAGDSWCWQSNLPTSNDEYQIWFCPHDSDLADIYAPSFAGWLYRCCLDYALSVDFDTDDMEEASEHMKDWSALLMSLGEEDFSGHLLSTFKHRDRQFFDNDLLRETIGTHFGMEYWENQIVWQSSEQDSMPDTAAVEAARQREANYQRSHFYGQATIDSDDAFRKGNFSDYVAILTPFQDMLTPSQQKKFAIAARKSGSNTDQTE